MFGPFYYFRIIFRQKAKQYETAQFQAHSSSKRCAPKLCYYRQTLRFLHVSYPSTFHMLSFTSFSSCHLLVAFFCKFRSSIECCQPCLPFNHGRNETNDPLTHRFQATLHAHHRGQGLCHLTHLTKLTTKRSRGRNFAYNEKKCLFTKVKRFCHWQMCNF